MDYLNLEGPDGQEDNMGGTTQKVYYAPIRDFLSIAVPAGSPTTPGDTVEIATAHTFKTGKCFKLLYCTMDKGKYDSEPQGDTDGFSFKKTAEVFYPGSNSEVHGLASKGKNDRFMFLIEMPDGTVIQQGNKMFYAHLKSKFSTGSNSSGTRGHTFTIESMGPENLLYSGAISLTPAP